MPGQGYPSARPRDGRAQLVARVGEPYTPPLDRKLGHGLPFDAPAVALEPREQRALPRRRLVEVREDQVLRRQRLPVRKQGPDLCWVDPAVLIERGEVPAPPAQERTEVALGRGRAIEIDVPIAAERERFGGPARGAALPEQMDTLGRLRDDAPPERERLRRPERQRARLGGAQPEALEPGAVSHDRRRHPGATPGRDRGAAQVQLPLAGREAGR
jgi:hypothetical protein